MDILDINKNYYLQFSFDEFNDYNSCIVGANINKHHMDWLIFQFLKNAISQSSLKKEKKRKEKRKEKKKKKKRSISWKFFFHSYKQSFRATIEGNLNLQS